MKKLSPRQEKFCVEYMVDSNASQAYKRSGYSVKGGGSSAAKLLKNPSIKARIDKLTLRLREVLEDQFDITQARIMKERARIAFFNMADLYTASGQFKPPQDWGVDIGAVITGVKTSTESGATVHDVRVSSKQDALLALEKMLGLYEEDNRQKTGIDKLTNEEINEQIEELVQRKKKAN